MHSLYPLPQEEHTEHVMQDNLGLFSLFNNLCCWSIRCDLERLTHVLFMLNLASLTMVPPHLKSQQSTGCLRRFEADELHILPLKKSVAVGLHGEQQDKPR